MGKAIAYLIFAAFGALLLKSTGLLDGMFDRGNLQERAKFWDETVARDTPRDSPKSAVDALLARHHMALECFASSVRPPVADCLADDPQSRGGTSVHPARLQLRFTFREDKLEKFASEHRFLK